MWAYTLVPMFLPIIPRNLHISPGRNPNGSGPFPIREDFGRLTGNGPHIRKKLPVVPLIHLDL